jgi:hypothetical protein
LWYCSATLARGRCAIEFNAIARIDGRQRGGKMFVWHTGFWGKFGTIGWSYDLMMVVMNLVIITSGGGNPSLGRLFQ